jgi:hypothetical protein
MGGRTPLPKSLPYRCRLQFPEGPDDRHHHHSQQRGQRLEQQSDRQGKQKPATAAESGAPRGSRRRRAARIAALHEQIGEHLEALTADPQWRAMLDAAVRFHTYSLNNQLLIASQAARLGISPTRVVWFGTWKTPGRSVVKGSTELAVLAPCTCTAKDTRANSGTAQDNRRSAPAATTAPGTAGGRPAGAPTGRPGQRGCRTGFRIAHVFDSSQTEGDPLPVAAPSQHGSGAFPVAETIT